MLEAKRSYPTVEEDEQVAQLKKRYGITDGAAEHRSVPALIPPPPAKGRRGKKHSAAAAPNT